MDSRGFTLIETLVYIGLFALIMSAAVAAVASIAESSGRDATEAELQEEGAFLIAKIEYELEESAEVTAPAAGAVTSYLMLVEDDGSTVTISRIASEEALVLARGSAAPAALSGIAQVTNASFADVSAAGDAFPEHIDISLTLAATSSTGALITGDFSTEYYVP
jgi:type II secretory pathway component PulJ